MKIYTKTGDKGETSLFTGERVAKNDPFMEGLGSVDECCSTIGVALSLMPNEEKFNETRKQLEMIQHALFDLGAAVATPRTRANKTKINKTRFDHEAVDAVEQWIDQMDLKLSKLKTFILPSGHPCGAVLHQARSICRRAERIIVPLNDHADVSDNVMQYLNRLSDYLFVASRYVNQLCGNPETLWQPHLAEK